MSPFGLLIHCGISVFRLNLLVCLLHAEENEYLTKWTIQHRTATVVDSVPLLLIYLTLQTKYTNITKSSLYFYHWISWIIPLLHILPHRLPTYRHENIRKENSVSSIGKRNSFAGTPGLKKNKRLSAWKRERLGRRKSWSWFCRRTQEKN